MSATRVSWRFPHLEDDFKGRQEHLIESFLLFRTAFNCALEVVLRCPLFQFLMRDYILQLCWITFSFSLISQIRFRANKNAWARLCSCFNFSDPFSTSLLERILINKTETYDKAISICVCNWSQSTQVFVTCRVPDLKFDFSPTIIFCTIVSIKYSWLVKCWEFLLSPRHDNWCLSHSCLSDKDQFDVMLFLCIYLGVFTRRNH